MNRHSSSKKLLPDSFYKLFAANSVLLVGMAFDLGLTLGRRTASTLVGRKVRRQVTDMAERVIDLAPASVANLVPDLAPSKSRPARRRKPSSKKRAG
jgi:hypothetical protein